MTEFASLVVYAADVEKTAAFYSAAGLDLGHEDHGDGPVHYAAELGPVHFAIYPAQSSGRAPARRAAGGSFPGFYVDSLDDATAALVGLGGPHLREHEEMPWGVESLSRIPTVGRSRSISETTLRQPDVP